MHSSTSTSTLTVVITVSGSSTQEVESPTLFSTSQTTTPITEFTIVPQIHDPFDLATFAGPWNPAVNVAYYILVVILPILVATNIIWYLYHGWSDHKFRRAERAKKKMRQAGHANGVTDEIELNKLNAT
jgi:hypothetical protein